MILTPPIPTRTDTLFTYTTLFRSQTNIKVSFDDPAYTNDVNATGAIRLLDAVNKIDAARRPRFYQASSSEMFGDAQGHLQNEKTPLHPLDRKSTRLNSSH